MRKARCTACDATMPWDGDMPRDASCLRCGVSGELQPHVVWFGEMPLKMPEIEARLAQCDLFVAVGTSDTVYPAANFVEQARSAGARTAEINLEPSGTPFHERRIGSAATQVPAWVDALLHGIDSSHGMEICRPGPLQSSGLRREPAWRRKRAKPPGARRSRDPGLRTATGHAW